MAIDYSQMLADAEAELAEIRTELRTIATDNANHAASATEIAIGGKPDAGGPHALQHMAYYREKRARERELVMDLIPKYSQLAGGGGGAAVRIRNARA
jgi:hypothetical protein